MEPAPVTEVEGARVLALLGDSVTTDHISPAGNISPTTPAGHYLAAKGVERRDFNSYGARRGNHEVMVRGTFANVRLRNQLAPGTEGGITLHLPDGEQTTIYEAAVRYAAEEVPLVVLAGKEYGSGSSRDWAAKGTALLGVRAVIAESYERIHRSNLIGMGVLPLQYAEGQNAAALGLTGHEVFAVTGLEPLNDGVTPKTVAVRAVDGENRVVEFDARLRIDTPMEAEYYRNGGILPYMLRQMAGRIRITPDTPVTRSPAVPASAGRTDRRSAGQGQDEPGDDHVVQDGADDGAGMEDLVVPEHARHRVRLLQGIDHRTGRVGQTAGQQQREAHPAQRPEELGQHDYGGPPHHHVGKGDRPTSGRPATPGAG